VTTVVLVRHGRSTANTAGVLAGWSPDVHLDDVGKAQANRVGERLAPATLDFIVASPLERTLETAEGINTGRRHALAVHVDDRLGECHYGEWTNRRLAELAKDPHWRVVQDHASAAVFPGGESLVTMQARAVSAIREWNSQARAYVVVSHGDVIKAVLADALGMHLDHFQRIHIDPGSVSVIRYERLRPFVTHVNDTGSDLSGIVPPRRRKRSSDAVVGGGSGSSA
jgi:probable phosphomutase (TIGR03848 family)